jgi:hypothetical protein
MIYFYTGIHFEIKKGSIMLNISKIVSIFVLIIISTEARIFFVGSNPNLSIIAYPQDVSKLPNEFVYFYPGYQKLPWWGDIDEPMHRPNDTYTVTGESTTESSTNSEFEHNGAIRAIQNNFGICFRPKPSYVQYIDLLYNINSFSNESSGKLTGSGQSIPYKYDVSNSSHEVLASSIWGFMFKGIPSGIKITAGFYDLGTPNQEFTFTKSGVDYESNRLLWGWSTTSCNHIFGVSGLDGDAWFQNEYSRGPLYRFDIQAGLTLEKLKLGSRLRFVFGKQDQYSWVPESSTIADSTIASNFSGDYEKSKWARKTTDAIIRLYGNYTWRKAEKYSLNTLVFLGYEARKAKNALTENLDIEDDAQEAIRSFVVEINPNINIYPWNKYSYIDAALLLEYSYSRYNNTSMQNVNGGTDGYWQTRVYPSDEYSWENFSYANENFIDLGLDISTSFPLYGNANRSLAFGLILLINTKFTWLNKYYGRNEISGSELKFVTENLRKNFKKEVWFNSMLSLNYRSGPIVYNFQVTEPLLYLLQPRTKVTDSKGKNVLYEHEKKGNWASQQDIKVALLVAYDLPTLKGMLKNHKSASADH